MKISHYLPIAESELTHQDRNFILYRLSMEKAGTAKSEILKGNACLNDVATLKVVDIISLKGCGNTALRRMRQVLNDEGLDFCDADQYNWEKKRLLPVKIKEENS